MALKTRKFDVTKLLETDQDVALYLFEALETGDAAYVAHAFGAVARARGMAKVARRTGLGRESLYKALSGQGNPELATVLRVAKALGIELAAKPAAARATRAKPPKRRLRSADRRRAALPDRMGLAEFYYDPDSLKRILYVADLLRGAKRSS
jgi:probable addiction module antidote protein